jgi:hypothetical protein
VNEEIRRRYWWWVLWVGLVAGSGVSRLAAQVAVHPQPGDSIHVRFSPLDEWHTGTVSDNPGDTLVISGCQDCRTEYLTPRSTFQIEVKPRSPGTQVYMHVGSGAHIGKAVGIGAGVGLIVGIVLDSRCHVVNNDVGGRTRQQCLPVASLILPVVGSVLGLLGGIATRPTEVPAPNDWVPATFQTKPLNPSTAKTLHQPCC